MPFACLYFLTCWGIDLPRRVPEYPRWVGLGLRVEGPAQNGEVRVRRASTLGRVIGWRKCPETKSPELPHPAACFSFTPRLLPAARMLPCPPLSIRPPPLPSRTTPQTAICAVPGAFLGRGALNPWGRRGTFMGCRRPGGENLNVGLQDSYNSQK